MSSAGENRQHFCESRWEEEDGDNADVDEDDEDDEEINMAIRNEIKRRAEKLLNMQQKVEDGKNAQVFKFFVAHTKEARVTLLISLSFTKILWKITEIHYRSSKRYLALDSVFMKTRSVI